MFVALLFFRLFLFINHIYLFKHGEIVELLVKWELWNSVADHRVFSITSDNASAMKRAGEMFSKPQTPTLHLPPWSGLDASHIRSS